MKRKLTLFIICVLALLLFAGCGKGSEVSTRSKFEIIGGFGTNSDLNWILRLLDSDTYYLFSTDRDTKYYWDDNGSVYRHDVDYYARNNVEFNVTEEEFYAGENSAQGWIANGIRIRVDFDKDAMTKTKPADIQEIKDYKIEGYCKANAFTIVGYNPETYGNWALKPVIYLYPEAETDVSVKLDYDGVLTSTYPSYNGGWNVTAHPDGTLISNIDGREYSYLFWEGQSNARYDMTKGFVVKGEDAAEFLQNTLSAMGLAPREYNEMIVFWLPQMEHNPYNLITFQKEAYTDGAALEIDPSPDSVLRVFMAWQSLDEPIDVEPPEIEPFERVGFTVVEWGGTEVR